MGIEGIFALEADTERGFVAGFYPAQVASVELEFKDGGRTRLPAVEGGYTGRYRGALRFVFAPIAPGRVVRGASLFDAAGHKLGHTEVEGPETEPRYRPLSTALRDGRARLRVGVVLDGARPGARPVLRARHRRASATGCYRRRRPARRELDQRPRPVRSAADRRLRHRAS